MRILHAIDSNGIYGAETMLLELAEEQQRRGHTPIVLSIGNEASGRKALEVEAGRRGLRCVPLRMRDGFSRRRAAEIIGAARAHRADIIHSHGYKPNILLAALPKRARRIPVIATLHGWTASTPWSKLGLYRFIDQRLLRRLDAVALVNARMKAIPAIRRLDARKVHAIPNGISLRSHVTPGADFGNDPLAARLQELKQRFGMLIGAIGRLSPEKNFGALIEAMGRLAANGVTAGIAILGDGPQAAQLERAIDAYGLKNEVLLAGYVEDARRYLGLFDLLVIPSLTEGLPMILLEAMAASVPVVASKVGDIPQTLGDLGTLIEPGNVDELARAIDAAWRDPEALRKKASAGSRRVAERFGAASMADGYDLAYSSLLESRALRICYVFQDEYPWDIRVEKFATTLADAGNKVDILARNRKNKPRHETLRPGIDVHRQPGGITPVDRTLMNFPAFFSPWWLSSIARTVREQKSDLILVRDLPLAAAAIWAGRATGRPVVMDMAENYPAMLQATWDFYGPKPWDYLIRNPAWLRKLERWVLPRLNGVFVVSDPSAERVRQITEGKVPVWTIQNTPRLDVAARAVYSGLAERISRHRGLTLLYVGHMDAKRGLDILVRALPSLKKTEPDVLAVIVGKGVMEPKLRALASELGVMENLLLAGWIDQAQVPSIIAAADIGLIPHLLTEHTDTTIPNKIYDYMAQGKPVVVTQCRTLKQIVETTGCGRVYFDRDPEALAEAAISLRDESTRNRLGAAGRRAVEERFRWDKDAEILRAAIEQIVTLNQQTQMTPTPLR